MKKTGKVLRKGKKFSLTEALPDSPIYSRGFVIGGMRTKDSSSDTAAKNSQKENKKQKSSFPSLKDQEKELDDWINGGMAKAAAHQMGKKED